MRKIDIKKTLIFFLSFVFSFFMGMFFFGFIKKARENTHKLIINFIYKV